MKRLRLIGMLPDREEVLRRLQHLGCVEIDEPTDMLTDPAWAELSRPGGTDLAAAKDAHAVVFSAFSVLNKYAPRKTGLFTPRPEVSEAKLFDDAIRSAALETAAVLNDGERHISALYAEESKLKNQKAAISPWLELTYRWRLPPPRTLRSSLALLPPPRPLKPWRVSWRRRLPWPSWFRPEKIGISSIFFSSATKTPRKLPWKY
jgi:V/A-type H+-transporting ATPase subunit I